MGELGKTGEKKFYNPKRIMVLPEFLLIFGETRYPPLPPPSMKKKAQFLILNSAKDRLPDEEYDPWNEKKPDKILKNIKIPVKSKNPKSKK